MRIYALMIGVLLSVASCDAQSREIILRQKVEDFKRIEDMPYYPELTGDSLFWEAVREKLEIVPYLIEVLDDTTTLDISVPNIGGDYTISDVAFLVMSEIIHDMPILEFVENPENSDPRDGSMNYWNYVKSVL